MTAAECAQTLIDLIVEETSGLDFIGRTIVARRIVGVLSGWLPKDEKPPLTSMLAMTELEAKEFGAAVIPFGVHQGDRYDMIATSYLCWLADASRETWRSLHRYLRSKRVVDEVATANEE